MKDWKIERVPETAADDETVLKIWYKLSDETGNVLINGDIAELLDFILSVHVDKITGDYLSGKYVDKIRAIVDAVKNL